MNGPERPADRPAPTALGSVRDARGEVTVLGAPLSAILAEAGVRTPAYVYDVAAVRAAATALVGALGDRGLCCYAIKANGAEPIARAIVEAGCGVDVVSGGELRLALAAGARPEHVVYSGVAKRDEELDQAIHAGIKGIHAESVEELERIVRRARALDRTAVPVGMRINPGVEVDTHAHIATGHDEAKFGIARLDLPRALDVIRASEGRVRLVGLSGHVGSMLMDAAPYAEGAGVVADLAREVRGLGFALEYVDVGGGYGVAYRDDQRAPDGPTFVRAGRAALDAHGLADLPMLIEPGRALVAAYGILVAEVIQPKRSGDRRWLLVDAGMNDLLRPALYQAHHRIEPLVDDGAPRLPWRVAGPVCESSDDFGTHPLPDPPPPHVVVREAGAYGRSMASTYNQRPIAPEVFVDGTAGARSVRVIHA